MPWVTLRGSAISIGSDNVIQWPCSVRIREAARLRKRVQLTLYPPNGQMAHRGACGGRPWLRDGEHAYVQCETGDRPCTVRCAKPDGNVVNGSLQRRGVALVHAKWLARVMIGPR